MSGPLPLPGRQAPGSAAHRDILPGLNPGADGIPNALEGLDSGRRRVL
jgi:hypothetical protein